MNREPVLAYETWHQCWSYTVVWHGAVKIAACGRNSLRAVPHLCLKSRLYFKAFWWEVMLRRNNTGNVTFNTHEEEHDANILSLWQRARKWHGACLILYSPRQQDCFFWHLLVLEMFAFWLKKCPFLFLLIFFFFEKIAFGLLQIKILKQIVNDKSFWHMKSLLPKNNSTLWPVFFGSLWLENGDIAFGWKLFICTQAFLQHVAFWLKWNHVLIVLAMAFRLMSHFRAGQ